MSSTQQSFLLKLPLELIYAIVAEDVLKKKDLKNLRLTHGMLATALCPVLFRNISLNFRWFKLKYVLVSTPSDSEGLESDSASGSDADNDTNGVSEDDDNYNHGNKDETTSNKFDLQSPEERLAAFRSKISDLKNKSLSSVFFTAVQSFTVDTTGYFNIGEHSTVEEFGSYKYTVNDFISWFPNLKTVQLKANTKGESKVVVKLIKGILRQKVPAGIQVILKLEGIQNHRACLQQVQNVTQLHIDAEPSKLDSFCQDLATAIGKSPNIHTLDITVRPGYTPPPQYMEYSSLRYTTNISAIMKGVPTTNLKRLKHLRLNLAAMSTSGSDYMKLTGLEDLSVNSYLLPSAKLTNGAWQGTNAPETLWDHLRKGAITLRKLEVKMVDKTLFRYLETTLARHIETLKVYVTQFEGDLDQEDQLSSQFWCEVIPSIAGSLKFLKVSSAVSLGGKSVVVQVPPRFLSSNQLFPKLEHLELPFAYKRAGAVSKILALLNSAQKLKTVTLDINFFAVHPKIKGEVNQQHARRDWQDEITQEIESQDGEANVLTGGSILKIRMHFGPFLTFRSYTINFRSSMGA